MKLTHVILSSDANPFYLDFFPMVSRMWQRLAGVTAVLALIAPEMPAHLAAWRQHILLVPPDPRLPAGLQAQCVRLLAAQWIDPQPTGMILLGDIDMLPMNSRYFTRPCRAARADDLVIFRDGVTDAANQIAMCYVAASAPVWRDLMGPVPTVADGNDRMAEWFGGGPHSGLPGEDAWYLDQMILYRHVTGFDPSRVRRLTDAQTGFRRLDRAHITNRLSLRQMAGAITSHYADYHMKRPQSRHAGLNRLAGSLALAGDGLFGRFR